MKIEQILNQKGLVQQTPSAEEILQRAKETEEIKLFYGETYDHTGNTIDSMKYYFFVADLAEALRNEGFKVDASILVADSAACRNVGLQLEHKYMQLGEGRAAFIESINEIYNTNLRIIKMSDYLFTPEFIQKREGIIDVCMSDEELIKMVEKSVPESKIKEERNKGFMYSYDELATIIDLDIKVGPPREDLYDNIAREIARRQGRKQLISLFLTPSFPLGKNWAYFFANEGIEDHGITAYKGGSKRLQDNRILVGRTPIEYVEELIDKSFISSNPELPNPVLDVGIIAELARQRLENKRRPVSLSEDFYKGRISQDQLKNIVKKSVNEYILSRLS